MTLLEVLAGLVLLATVMVAILTSHNRSLHQAGRAQLRLAAVRAADHLLSQWWTQGFSIPHDGSGEVSDDNRFTWATQVIPDAAASRWEAQVLRLTIQTREPPSTDPLAQVDLLIPAGEQP